MPQPPKGDYIEVDVQDMCKRIQLRVRAVEQNVKNMSKLFQMMEARFIEYWEDAFDSEGATMLGHKWQKLTDEYLQWKLKHGYPEQIGTYKGRMRESLTGGTGYQSRVGSTSASFGQQAGAVPYQMNFIKARNGTVRPLTINDATRRSWVALAQSYFSTNLKPVTHMKPYREAVVVRTPMRAKPIRYYASTDSRGRTNIIDPVTKKFVPKSWVGRFAKKAGYKT